MIVMEVLKQVMKAAQEDLAARKQFKLKGKLQNCPLQFKYKCIIYM